MLIITITITIMLIIMASVGRRQQQRWVMGVVT